VNTAIITGTVSISPKNEVSPTGTKYTYFGLQSVETNKGKEFKTYVDVTCFGYTADHAMQLRQGDSVLVQGKLSTRKKKDVYTLGVMCNLLEFLGGPGSSSGTPSTPIAEWAPQETIKEEDVISDVPF